MRVPIATVIATFFASPGLAQHALQLSNTSTVDHAYVRIADDPSLEPQQFTLELWFKPSGPGFGNTGDASGAALIAKPREGASGQYLGSWYVGWLPSTGQVIAMVVHAFGSQGVFLYSTSTVAIGASAHVALRFDGASLELYLDGALEAAQPFGYTGVYYGAEDVLIGANNLASGYLRRFAGVIDDVRIWDHARDPRAIEMLRNCRLSGSEAGLRAYYTFDASSLVDNSGNGHDGTLVGPSASYVTEPVALTACGSPSQSYCTAGTSTNGCAATLSASGIASVTQTSGFTLTASGVEGQKLGLVFYGVTGAVANAWASGSTSLLCVKSPVQRGITASSGGSAGACNGALSLDFLAFVAANPGTLGAPFSAGQTVRVQAWYRDPPAPGTTNLSNGLCFVTAP